MSHPSAGKQTADLVAARRPSESLLIAVLMAQVAYGLLVMTICVPSMQEWGAIFRADQASVQLTLSAYVLAQGAVQLIYGPMSDRHGRKPILLFGVALACLGSWLAAIAPDLPTLIAARTLQGAGSAAGLVAGRALVQDLFQGPRRTQVLAYVGMTMGVSPPLAIVVGGQLHVQMGWQANFVLTGLLTLALFVVSWHVLPAPAAGRAVAASGIKQALADFARLAREPRYLLHVALLSMTMATFYAFLSGSPIVMRGYGVGPRDLGWYIMVVPVGYIFGSFTASRLTHLLGDGGLMRAGQWCSFCGLGLLIVLGLAGQLTALMFALPLVLLGFGHALLMPAALSRTVSLIPALAGSAAALAGLAQLWSGAMAGYAVGLLPSGGAMELGLLMLFFSVLALVAQLLLRGR